MRSLRRFLARLFNFAGKRVQDERLKEEIEEHIALQTEENLRAGLPPTEARRQALVKFGGMEAIKQDYRAERGLPWIEDLLRDLRFALRMLRKSPSFAITAVTTLAVAIAANTIAFGALNALVLRPLDVPHSENIYEPERASDKQTADSYPNYLDLRDRNRSFDDLAAFTITQPGLDAGGNPTRVCGYQVTGNYFDVLGVKPYLGRLIHASDERGYGSAPYIVLTYGFWHSDFHADRNVVGRAVRLNKQPYTIIGVAPRGFRGTLLIFSPNFFVPIANDNSDSLRIRGNRGIDGIFGHLKRGVTPAQATADLNSVASYLQKTYPKDDDRLDYLLARPQFGGDFLGAGVKAFVSVLMVLAGLILLASCANLGNLFAARAADRAREVALRLALGASRMRVLRQLFTEAILISLAGGAVGLCASILLLHRLSTWNPFPQYPLNVPLTPDANVYGAALLLSLASGLLFGAVPVRQVLHTDPYQIVKAGSIPHVGRGVTIRDLALGMQIALCAVLVTSSFVAVRGLVRSLHSNFGFDPRNVLLAETDLGTAGYSKDSVPVMQKRMLDSVQTIPGVTSAAWVGLFPPLHLGWDARPVFSEKAADLKPSNAVSEVMTYSVSPDYLQTASSTLLMGRAFTLHDDKDAPSVALINEHFAQTVFGSLAAALGGYFKLQDGTRIQVVGIVKDGKYTTNLAEAPQSAMFLPILQSPSDDAWLLLRWSDDSRQMAAAVRNKLHGLDSGLPVFIQTWNEEMNGALFAPRMASASLGILGIVGAVLSVTGIFGMAAYAVSKRKRDLGIRMALGAQRSEILTAALGRAVRLLTIGSVVGLLLGILASRVLAAIVYTATPRDPFVLTGVVLAMALLGLVATWIPAQRALSIDPATLLRED